MAILSKVKEMIRGAGKHFYTFVVGKLNPEKLANFTEIDIFVCTFSHVLYQMAYSLESIPQQLPDLRRACLMCISRPLQ